MGTYRKNTKNRPKTKSWFWGYSLQKTQINFQVIQIYFTLTHQRKWTLRESHLHKVNNYKQRHLLGVLSYKHYSVSSWTYDGHFRCIKSSKHTQRERLKGREQDWADMVDENFSTKIHAHKVNKLKQNTRDDSWSRLRDRSTNFWWSVMHTELSKTRASPKQRWTALCWLPTSTKSSTICASKLRTANSPV